MSEQETKDDRSGSAELIRRLCEADGVSGYEGAVAQAVRRELEPHASVEADSMGNLVGTLEGGAPGPRLMLCAHMDEIGMVTQSIGEDGRIHFLIHGAWWEPLMLQQPVLLRTSGGTVPGIVSSTASFFLPRDELKQYEATTAMFVDVGARTRKEAEAIGIQVGDPILFDSPFRRMAPDGLYAGKALDDRLGLASLVETARHFAVDRRHRNTLLLAATVQEEIGCRGAQAVTRFCEPDLAIVVEGPPADDIPLRPGRSQCVVGEGVHIRRREPGMLCSGPLYRLAVETAERLGIRHQKAVAALGGTDGSQIHGSAQGIPCLMIGVPVRYAHAHHSVFHLGDYEAMVQLLIGLVERIDSDVLREVRENPYG